MDGSDSHPKVHGKSIERKGETSQPQKDRWLPKDWTVTTAEGKTLSPDEWLRQDVKDYERNFKQEAGKFVMSIPKRGGWSLSKLKPVTGVLNTKIYSRKEIDEMEGKSLTRRICELFDSNRNKPIDGKTAAKVLEVSPRQVAAIFGKLGRAWMEKNWAGTINGSYVLKEEAPKLAELEAAGYAKMSHERKKGWAKQKGENPPQTEITFGIPEKLDSEKTPITPSEAQIPTRVPLHLDLHISVSVSFKNFNLG